LVQKVKQGVKVCVIYDDFGCMTTLPQHYYKELTAEGIECIPFNRFSPILSQLHNNRDHRKIYSEEWFTFQHGFTLYVPGR
jgi:cardiolipin synthase